MKLLLLSLCCTLILTASAQTEFKLNAGTPLREYHEVKAIYKDGFILKFTSNDPAKRGTGKFVKYSTGNSAGSQKPYKLDLNFKTMPIADIMLLKDGHALLAYGGSVGMGDVSQAPNVMRWQSGIKDYSIQPFDLNTMQATGTPKVIGIPTKKDMGVCALIYSPEGKRLAIMSGEYNVYSTFKYKLMDGAGNELFIKEYTLPIIKNYRSVNEYSIRLTESGELAFTVADYKDHKEPGFTLVKIDANQKLITKKVEVKGKYVSNYADLKLEENGNLIVTIECYKDASQKFSTGKITQTYGPALELISEKEVECPECKLPKFGEVTKLDGGGYIAIAKETGQRQTGPAKWDNTYSKLTCVGYNDKLEEIYRYDVHSIDKSSTWCIYRPFAEYIEGDNIYIFHGGTDDKVKNTKEEFELYCTYWQHGKTKPQTVKLQLPFPDLNLEMAWFKVMDKNKLFITGEGNGGKVYTTLNIINR